MKRTMIVVAIALLGSLSVQGAVATPAQAGMQRYFKCMWGEFRIKNTRDLSPSQATIQGIKYHDSCKVWM
ncbi:MAG TPA: hypothetical protein VMF31_12345 [Solirubrobacterales bacterium]|nr:hypothetical protein [Solirubrobacterales bacterium]